MCGHNPRLPSRGTPRRPDNPRTVHGLHSQSGKPYDLALRATILQEGQHVHTGFSSRLSYKGLAAAAVLPVLGLIVAATAAARATEVLYTLESPNGAAGSNWFGRCVSGAGDVNNDGHDDVIVGAYWEDGGAPNAGRAYVFSGNGGGLLYTLQSPNPGNHGHFGGEVSCAGDVNDDGYDDVVVGAAGETVLIPSDGRAYLFSGANGNLLHTLTSPRPKFEGYFGSSVSGAGDVNNDGYADVIVGAEQEDGGVGRAGRSYIFSGNGYDLLYILESPQPELLGYFGGSVSCAGDVDGDGHDDLIVGAHWEDVATANDGRAYVFSGDGAGLLYALESPDVGAGGSFGHSVSGAGDVNNDGHADVIAGAYREAGGAQWAGRAYVFSGDGGCLLHTLESPNAQYWGWFGRVVSGAGDVNNDGHADVIVGAGAEDGSAPGTGMAYVFSGSGAGLLAALESPAPEENGAFGYWVCGGGHVNGDACEEVIIGAHGEDGGGPNAGRAYVFDLAAGGLVLSGSLTGEGLQLGWTPFPGAASYWVYGAANEAYFAPGLTAPYEHRLVVLPPLAFTWSSPSGVGDPNQNWTYQLVAVTTSGQPMRFSNRFGEHDFDAETGP